MKYPSEVLHEVADKLDSIEDELLERYYGKYIEARQWVAGWKVWEYHAQQQKLNTLRERHDGLRNDYYELCKLYREKIGETPPLSTWAALSSMDSALRGIARKWRNALTIGR